MRGLGWLKDKPKLLGEAPDHLFEDFKAERALGAAPVTFSLAELVLKVLDQGQLGSCVSNATAQALRMRLVAQGVSAPPLPARLMIYYLARAVDHATSVDAGTYPRVAMEILNKFGFAPESLWPYSDKNDSSAKDPFKLMPTMEVFQAAFDQHAPTKYVRITSSGNQRLVDLKTAIAGGFPVIFGCNVSEAFCQGDFDASKPLDPPAAKDSAGGHCMIFEGYDGDDLTVLNSWSEDFGEKGRIKFSPKYLAACDDLWAIDHTPVEGEV